MIVVVVRASPKPTRRPAATGRKCCETAGRTRDRGIAGVVQENHRLHERVVTTHSALYFTANPARGLNFFPSDVLVASTQIAAGCPSRIGFPVIDSLVPTLKSLGLIPAR